ncbi:MAG TPA: type I-U CRISPR-associated RAMP protein Csb1/Cas7u [Bryobacteraceae bacterium]|nr:type I-U CRISPR-associated RAMP protein Csb1/Cas7u [Bryobacteraceae bacterium]
MPDSLSFQAINTAIQNGSAAFRCRTRLYPVGDTTDKVFPPTYAGGVYAVEDRRVDGQVVRCVVLDSVQSQANRMEELLQDAFLPNWRELPETEWPAPQQCELPMVAVHIPNHGWITSLTAPHRIHDAILRDSEIAQGNNGGKVRFRDSTIGKEIVAARLYDASAFYRYCPTALLFGTWDSTAGEGLNSAKVPRAIVSEIVGVDAVAGVRTASRIDPLGIEATAATIYRRKVSPDCSYQDWAAKVRGVDGEEKLIGAKSEDEIERTKQGLSKFGLRGRPSDINHGNIPPNLVRFDPQEVRDQNLDRLPDILQNQPLRLNYKLESRDGRLNTDINVDRSQIRGNAVKPGGVTVAYALHTWVLSLNQLRRLRFPAKNGKTDENDNGSNALRTVLAALGLYALSLQVEQGYWLRSRCELVPDKASSLILEEVGTANQFSVPSSIAARQILTEALNEAKPYVEWEKNIIRLTPMSKLVQLVAASDRRRPDEDSDPPLPAEEPEDFETPNAGDQD